jgi:transcriptional regulator with XRE-family HTH domain
MEIGQNIRNLRRERELTQEELAERIGVTSQAVSKWESGAGLPDISQIVPLASVFEVSTDALFGTSATSNDAEVRKMMEAANPQGARQSLTVCREILKKYPTNLLALNLACRYSHMVATGAFSRARDTRIPDYLNVPPASEEDVREAALECEKYSNQFLKYGKGHVMYAPIQQHLVGIYAILGKIDEAKALAETFTYFPPERGHTLAAMYMYSGNISEELRLRKECVRITRDNLCNDYSGLADAYERAGDYEAAVDAVKSSFESLPDFRSCVYIAKYYLKQGDTDSCFEWLEKMLEFCNSPDTVPTYHAGKKLSAYEMCEMEISVPEFEPLRSDPRYAALRERIETLKE